MVQSAWGLWRPNVGIIDSNPTNWMDACRRFFSLCCPVKVGSSRQFIRLSRSSTSYIEGIPIPKSRRQDTVAGIETGYELVPVRSRIFSTPRRPDRFWGPPSLLSNEYRGPFPPGMKRPGFEAEHSPPASVEVKKMWIFTCIPPYVFMA
jgi:hypothetical protein